MVLRIHIRRNYTNFLDLIIDLGLAMLGTLLLYYAMTGAFFLAKDIGLYLTTPGSSSHSSHLDLCKIKQIQFDSLDYFSDLQYHRIICNKLSQIDVTGLQTIYYIEKDHNITVKIPAAINLVAHDMIVMAHLKKYDELRNYVMRQKKIFHDIKMQQDYDNSVHKTTRQYKEILLFVMIRYGLWDPGFFTSVETML